MSRIFKNFKKALLLGLLFFVGLCVLLVVLFSEDPYANQSVLSEKPTPQKPFVEDQQEALIYLKDILQKDNVYNWSEEKCIRFQTDENENFYILEIRQLHFDNLECPGDPRTSPLISQFQVDKLDGSIFWLDIIADKFITYQEYKELISSIP